MLQQDGEKSVHHCRHYQRMQLQSARQAVYIYFSTRKIVTEEPTENFFLSTVSGQKNAAKGEIPWQVLLTREPDSIPVKLLCSGTLISANFVLTAAQCTAGRLVKYPKLNFRFSMV
jgi:secreted trypsin-like serine protease